MYHSERQKEILSLHIVFCFAIVQTDKAFVVHLLEVVSDWADENV